ncbi:MAG: molybdate ABC transporter substrate-binding protein [Desulfobacterales bacterium]|nr:molybdate ABC transporter substrate-binding protein [Desulfobacterales bacterium]
MFPYRKRCVFILIILLLLPGMTTAGDELIVSAAASLTNAMREIEQQYEISNPEVDIILNLASSGSLLQQMIHGAPVDVFASANQKFMNKAEEEGLILKDSKKNFVRNTLVLAVNAPADKTPVCMEDILQPFAKRVAVGNPDSVPAGLYTREALMQNGLWEKISDKIIYANSVRQVLDYLIRGEVDAGFIYSTDAVIGGDKIKVVTHVEGHKPIIYPIAVLASSHDKARSAHFIDFVLSERGQQIFAKFGFKKP